MSIRRRAALAALMCLSAPMLTAQQPGTPAPQTPAAGAAPQATPTPPRRPRPYAQVITNRANTSRGGITVHQVEDRWFFEVPDSLVRRDFLLVSRIAGVPTNFPGFTSAGTSLESRLVRWERQGDRLILRGIATVAYSEDSLPIAISVASNNVGPILASFPAQAYTSDSASVVADVTDFFSGDTPGISGLNAAMRRQFQVRRLDPARSFINVIRTYPMNVEVRQTQTFDAGEPPSDASSGTISLEMRQSIVLLPKEPMRPRYADERVGFFSVSRVNYGLDEQKAATQRFIRRWRLEPKDPAAYARGELVEPVKPIVYYLDPATPAKWRPYVRQGVNDWSKVFEAAGFKNAVQAKDPPSKQEDPTWDPEDIRYSVVRWAASTVRNAVGPSTSDPRTGEIIESDITWYHNHMRSYRNRLLTETGASNPAAQTLDIPESLMGETMRQVITHEVGHALGLPHNMAASSSYPVDSLRSRSFTSVYGVSATIMDYARQNYVAQPGDGLAGNDFIRRLGPFDRFVINWGYRVFPSAQTPEAERAILNGLVANQTGPMPYRYISEQLTAIDPRSQTEDIGDDPIRASTYAIANMKRMVPNLVAWTTKPGEDYDDLSELYGEALANWSRYMNHVAALIGGVTVNAKTADQAGAVYDRVPRARQQAALRFLASEVFQTPTWLVPDAVLSRIGPQPTNASLVGAQGSVLTQLTDARRLARLADAEAASGANYGASTYLADLRVALWGGGLTPDANRRVLHRLHVQRLATFIAPPAAAAPAAPPNPNAPTPSALATQPDVPRTDLPALARAELRAIRSTAASAARGSTGLARAHWADIVDRVDVALEAQKR